MLFNRPCQLEFPRAVIGIPRCLNMYEEYPFWHTLFSSCNIQVILSAPSTFARYEENAKWVMSDNICFPAKLVHSHIQDLIDHKVERIFMPFVVFERMDGGQNSYNCPIVSGYSEVIKSVQDKGILIDSPTITFKDKHLLYKQCQAYLKQFGVNDSICRQAFRKAMHALEEFDAAMLGYNRHVLEDSRSNHRLCVLLVGRPYHTDPLIQHKLSDLAASMGVNILTDDIVRSENFEVTDAYILPQWAYVNRILKAVKWAAMQGDDIQCMQMTSFGCGPDAF